MNMWHYLSKGKCWHGLYTMDVYDAWWCDEGL